MADVRMEPNDGYGEVKAENMGGLAKRHPEKSPTRARWGAKVRRLEWFVAKSDSGCARSSPLLVEACPHRSSGISRTSTSVSCTSSRATLTAARNRRGPALPGFT